MSKKPSLYRIKFKPIYKEKIWGGLKLNTKLGKNIGALKNAGESWEISGVNNNISIVANGKLSGLSLTQIICFFNF